MFANTIQGAAIKVRNDDLLGIEDAMGKDAILGKPTVDRAEGDGLTPVLVERAAPGRLAHCRGYGCETLVFHGPCGGGKADAIEPLQRIRAGWHKNGPGARLYLCADEGRELGIEADGNADPSEIGVKHLRWFAGAHSPVLGLKAGQNMLFLECDAAVG